MTPNPYSEDHLVEQPALALLAELGWQTACGSEEAFAPDVGSQMGAMPCGDLCQKPRTVRSGSLPLRTERPFTTPFLIGASSGP